MGYRIPLYSLGAILLFGAAAFTLTLASTTADNMSIARGGTSKRLCRAEGEVGKSLL